MTARLAARNLVANAVLQVANAVAGLIIPALIIKSYGSSVNGLVGSIRQFLGFAALVEAGLGMAAIASLYRPIAAHDNSSLSSIMTAIRVFYQRTGWLFLIAVIGIALGYPLVLRGQLSLGLILALVAVLGSVQVFDYFVIAKYRVLLFASGRNYIMSFAQTVNVLVTTGVSVGLVSLGSGVVPVFGASSLISILSLLFVKYSSRRIFPDVTYASGEPNFHALGARRAAFVQQMTGMVIFNTPVILLTFFVPLSDVSVYLVYSMIFAAVGSLVGIVSTALLAMFGELGTAGDLARLRRAFVVFEELYYMFMTWAYVCATVLIMPFIHIYTSGMTDAEYSRPVVAVLFALVGVANGTRIPFNVLVTSHGLFRETVWRAVIEMAINIVASLVFVYYLGMVGVLLGALCSYAYRVVDFIVFASRRVLRQSPLAHVEPIVFNLVAGFILALAGLHVVPSELHSYARWALCAVTVSVTCAVGLLLANLAIRPNARGAVRKLVPRFGGR